MTHKRKSIIEAVKTQLATISGLTVSGPIFSNVPAGTSPHCTVKAVSEDVENTNLNRRLSRDLTIELDIVVFGSSSIDETLHSTCSSVEIKMAEDLTFSGLVFDSAIVSTELNYEGDAENKYGQAIINYRLNYETSYTNPEG
jgi:hypothetical protein